MPSNFKYPGVEVFNSIQGEGFHSGEPMTFIRLAGCNVGRQASMQTKLDAHSLFPIVEETRVQAHTICCDVNGIEFLCDTDYRARVDITPEFLLEFRMPHRDVSITGGEPFIHALEPLLEYLAEQDKRVNIETSGTKPIELRTQRPPWIVCSPKRGLLDQNIPRVDEWKILVDKNSEYSTVLSFVRHLISVGCRHGILRVSIQPINGIDVEHHENLRAAVNIACQLDATLNAMPNAMMGLNNHRVLVSPQLHKHLNVP